MKREIQIEIVKKAVGIRIHPAGHAVTDAGETPRIPKNKMKKKTRKGSKMKKKTRRSSSASKSRLKLGSSRSRRLSS